MKTQEDSSRSDLLEQASRLHGYFWACNDSLGPLVLSGDFSSLALRRYVEEEIK